MFKKDRHIKLQPDVAQSLGKEKPEKFKKETRIDSSGNTSTGAQSGHVRISV